MILIALSANAVWAVAIAPAAPADTAPASGTPATVSADALPTVQINGVVWSQVTIGNTVYATGSFTRARPAGAAAGKSETARSNLLAYRLTTGLLLTTFNHTLNGQGRTITASPDGARVYVGGDFTKVDGKVRNHLAAFDTSTGALDTSFAPNLNDRVYAVTATNTTVYAGGAFTAVGVAQRLRLAAFSSAGALLTWAPSVADQLVSALVVSPDQTRVIVGGRFSQVNGLPARGLVALDPAPSTGTTNQPWAATARIWYGVDANGSSGVTSLRTDGTNIYGTAYVFCGGTCGTLEGSFAADPDTGAIKWVEDCHGDTYDSFTIHGVLYQAGHPHFCGNIGAYPEKYPGLLSTRRALAFDVNGSNTNLPNSVGNNYTDWGGTPAPVELDWYPDLTGGTFTGQGQAAWSVTGNASYVAYGGEFPTVNGKPQQGLVRFAVRSLAPNKQGPKASWTLTPTALSKAPASIDLRWETTFDPDNLALTYRVQRDAKTIATITWGSNFWERPTLSVTDRVTGTHSYRVLVSDPFGNTVTSAAITAAAITTPPPALGAYASDVVADGATSFWQLDETSGSTGHDSIGNNDLVEQPGFRRGAGAIAGDPNGSAAASGTSTGYASSTSLGNAPETFSVEAWFKTTSTSGGQIVGFNDSITGVGSYADRTIFLNDAGNVVFHVFHNQASTWLFSPQAYNDGGWHHVVATMSSTGASPGTAVYVDGVLVGSAPSSTSAEPYTGYWRIGGGLLPSYAAFPSSQYLAGSIDDVAIYPIGLTAAQVMTHYTDGSN